MNIPNDPAILVSYMNTQLRDFYPTLTECCKALGLEQEEICRKLSSINYQYDSQRNQFV